MTGDRPERGDHVDATAGFDLCSASLMTTARTLRDDGTLLSGRLVDPPPRFLLGAVDNPAAGMPHRLAQKVGDGAEFVQTQFVFDVVAFATWMGEVRDRGLHERCGILAGSARSVPYGVGVHAGLPGVVIPAAFERRLRGVAADRVAAAGMAACADTVAAFREVPGVAGFM